MMDEEKRKRLEADGWTVGGVQDLLGLTDEQMVKIDKQIEQEEVAKKERGDRHFRIVGVLLTKGSGLDKDYVSEAFCIWLENQRWAFSGDIDEIGVNEGQTIRPPS